MELSLERYSELERRWPAAGRHLLATFDDHSIVVYQAFRPSTAEVAARDGRFGDGFSLNRMSWIKPNFLWMMFRSGWATKPAQERVLAITLPRVFFDRLLTDAVWSTHDAERFPEKAEWQSAVHGSDVRLQWDPDHDPEGNAVERRAVQIGLRGAALRDYVDACEAIDDVTEMVQEQKSVLDRDGAAAVRVPAERVYTPGNPAAIENVRLDRLGKAGP